MTENGTQTDGTDTGGGGLNETVACPGCGAVYERRYLTECCRYEAGEGYRCPACDHLLERED
ncbi:MAG: hypothetical protein OEY97_07015 [Nitrospirota bacterium]|nr:hypothetical protein [Nitrospirota bacterium]